MGEAARVEVPGPSRPAAGTVGPDRGAAVVAAGAPVDVRPSWWAWPSYLVLAAAAGLALLDPGLVHRARFIPLLASLVVLGLPHGAVDHLVPGWVRGRRLGMGEMGALLAGYVAVTAAGAALWLLSPVAALVGFFAVTIVHWGSAELPWARRPSLPGGFTLAAFAVARGAVPILVPAVAFPRAFAAGGEMLLAPFGAGRVDLAPSVTVRLVLAAALLLVCLLGAGRERRARLELVGLIAFFAVVPPIFAIGIYFIVWHSWRHVLRLATVHPAARRDLLVGHGLRAVGRVLRAALPCTLIALAGMAIFGAVLSVQLIDPRGAIAVALALIAALTVPHTLVVAWWDRQGRRG